MTLPLGLIGLYIGSGLLTWVTGFVCGKAYFEKIIKVVVWSNVPTLISLVFCLIAILVGGQKAFTSLPHNENASSETVILGVALFVFGLSRVVTAVWSLVLLIVELAEVQKCSIGRASVSVLLLPAAGIVFFLLFKLLSF